MKLPKIFQGVGGDALTGIAAAAAVGANPLLGLLATPYLKTRREGVEADTKGRMIENEMGQLKLDTLAGIPSILQNQNAGVNPVTGEPVAMEEGLTPYDTTGQRLQAAAMFPGMSSALFPQQEGGRLNQRQLIETFRQHMGRDPNEEELKSLLGMGGVEMSPKDRIALLETQVRLEMLMRDLKKDQETDVIAETAELQNLENMTYDLDLMQTSLGVLEGGLFEPGGGIVKDAAEMFAPVAQWALKMAGEEATADQIQGQRDALNSFRKASSRFMGNTLEQMNNEGITVTRGLQSLVESMNANENMTPGSIRIITQMAAKEIMKARMFSRMSPEDQRFIQKTASGYDGQFGSIEEAQVAINQGLIKPGDVFYIKGRPHTAQE